MDFKLSKTHLLMQEMFRKFAETEIKPLAEDMDEAEEYSPELLAKLQRYGFFGIPYSREYGGVGSFASPPPRPWSTTAPSTRTPAWIRTATSWTPPPGCGYAAGP